MTGKRFLRIKAFLLLSAMLLCGASFSQFHENIVNYAYNGTPTNGVKIKTTLPFTSGSQMPTIHIYGYNYRSGEPIDISLVYYIYDSAFINYGATSSGGYQPVIKLANENGKVVIFIDDRRYFQRFTVSVYAKGMPAEGTTSYFQGWTAVDERLSGTQVVTIPYKNTVTGSLGLPGGIWTSTGRLGIGTTAPGEALSVNGTVQAREVNVTTSTADWPDYVFREDYSLTPLDTLERQIRQAGHLPELPSADEIKANGQSLGQLNKQLVKKVEELTLYILQQHKEMKAMQAEIQQLKPDNEKKRQ